MKKQALALVMSVLMLFVTACGGSGSPSGTASPAGDANSPAESVSPSSAAPVADAGTEGLDMTFWIFLNPESTEDPRNVVLKEILDSYNQTNEYGNKVTVESIHWSKFESQAIQAAAAGTGPDVINCFSDMLRTHIEGGTLQPMTGYAESFIGEIPDYIHTADNLKVNGDIYALPWESRVTVMWYRTDVYPSAPKTHEDIRTMGAAATQDLALGYVIGTGEGSNATGLMETFIPLIRSAGGDLYDGNGKAIFNSEAGVKTIEFMKSLVEAGTMDQTAMSMTYDDVVDGFKGGTILAMNAGTQRAATIKSSDLAANFASAPIPGFDGNPAPAFVAGQQVAIGKYAQNPDMSFDFIRYYLSAENQEKWINANVLPVRAAAYESEAVKSMPNYDEMIMWSDYAKTGKMEFFPADYPEMSFKLGEAVQNILYQGADTQAKLNEVADWYNNK